MPSAVTTYFFRLPRLAVARQFDLGPVALLPAGAVAAAVDRSLTARRGDAPSWFNDMVRDRANEWHEDAALRVEAVSEEAAEQLANEAMATFRLFLRPHVRVNVDIHKIGREGEIPLANRERIVILPDGGASHGFRWLDGTIEFTIIDSVLDAWEKDPRLSFIAHQLSLSPSSRSELGRKALTAIEVLDAAFLAHDASETILFAVMALETLLSATRESYSSQTLEIARRVAYLTCPAEHGTSGKSCLYLGAWTGGSQLFARIEAAAATGPWLCTPFTDIATPKRLGLGTRRVPREGEETWTPHTSLFELRNEVAHEGRTSLTWEEARHWRHRIDDIVFEALDWFATHPDGSVDDLDGEIRPLG